MLPIQCSSSITILTKTKWKMHCIIWRRLCRKNRSIVQFSARLIGITEKPKFENKLKRNDNIPESLCIGSITHISHWIKVLSTGYKITSRQCEEHSCCASVRTQWLMMTAGMSYSDRHRNKNETAGLTPSPTRGTLRCLCECVFLYTSVWLFVCVCEIEAPLHCGPRGPHGINGCHSFQRHGVLSCHGWLVAGWIQFLLLSSCPSFLILSFFYRFLQSLAHLSPPGR